ncbi:Glycosyl transferase family 1 [uncultured archaeon]|nr:Glycosyl transferase family 1 [uncultured archaeon]
MGHIFISPLSWGLGHAARVTPIIRELLTHGHEVTIATSGGALEMLKKEFPGCHFIFFQDYPAPYSSTRFFLPKFALSIPNLTMALGDEKKIADSLLSGNKYDMVISDSRLGVYSDNIPSFFISHQLRFSLPSYIKPVETFSLYINEYFHKKFERIIIPDNNPDTVCLSGKLCLSTRRTTNMKAYYSGILCPSHKMDVPEDLDFLISISGPEPQRSKLEEILLRQVKKLPGEKVVLLGRPRDNFEKKLDRHTTVKSYVSYEEKNLLMNRAKFIISRSGYTTMMEIAELDKKHGLFTPTPGQTEQEYLSEFYEKQRWFHSKSQYGLDLLKDVDKAMEYKGFPAMQKTKDNMNRLYEEVLVKYL